MQRRYLLPVMMNRTGACRRRSPVRSHWRWLSARWHLAQTGECQGRAFGWQRQASGEWEAGCGRRLIPRCPAVGWSAAGACAEPPGWQGRGSSTLDWKERRKEKKMESKKKQFLFIYSPKEGRWFNSLLISRERQSTPWIGSLHITGSKHGDK